MRPMSDTLAGKLLVAMPGIGDPRFEQSVIVMCSHDERHAMGVVVNKPKEDLTVSEVLDHLGIAVDEDAPDHIVLDGGPVQPERGFVLHSDDFAAREGTHVVAPGLNLTATRDVLEAVASDEPPAQFILALGHAGWGAGQLEDELRHNVWLVVDADDRIIFDEHFEDKWTRAIRLLGFDPAQLTSNAGRA
jgi:putative transcriptional regulator